MPKTLVALMLGVAMLLTTAVALACDHDRPGGAPNGTFGEPVQTEPVYLGPITGPPVDNSGE